MLGPTHWTYQALLATQLDHWLELAVRYAPRADALAPTAGRPRGTTKAEARTLRAVRDEGSMAFADLAALLDAIWRRAEQLWELKHRRQSHDLWETLGEVVGCLDAWDAVGAVVGSSRERAETALLMARAARERTELEYGADSDDAREAREIEAGVAAALKHAAGL